jgi:hypothetical protein
MAKKRQKTKKRKGQSIWAKLGRKGGKARAARLTAAERHRIAMLGVEARRARAWQISPKKGKPEHSADT